VIALALLLAAQTDTAAARYGDLVAQAVARAHAGDRAAAESMLQRARALDPARGEALVELAGLRFLDGRYAEAVALLRPALRRGAGAHARALLGTSLHLLGRGDEAVEAWNPLRLPVVRNLHVSGLHDTRARLVVPQLRVSEGALLTRDDLRATRLQLSETGAFARVAVRPVPLGTGEADVDVALVERRGFGSPPELAALTASKALQRTAYLRYDNLAGAGIGAHASYRWQSTQPRADAGLSWPRPFGLDATLLASAEWERPRYDLGASRFTLEARGAALAARHVVGPRTVAAIGWRGRRRAFAVEAPPTPSEALGKGLVSGMTAALEHRLIDGWRVQVDARAQLLGAARPLGSDLEFGVGRAGLRSLIFLAPPERTAIERSVLAAQLIVGRATGRTPVDEMFVPGAASEMDLPLRAYRSRDDGVLGRTPIGRSLDLLNLEWRVRLGRWKSVQVGGVAFYDAARIGRAVGRSDDPFLQAVGGGLRAAMLSLMVRIDYAVALSDPSSRALTAGLSQAF
jgi:hypothetical protein